MHSYFLYNFSLAMKNLYVTANLTLFETQFFLKSYFLDAEQGPIYIDIVYTGSTTLLLDVILISRAARIIRFYLDIVGVSAKAPVGEIL